MRVRRLADDGSLWQRGWQRGAGRVSSTELVPLVWRAAGWTVAWRRSTVTVDRVTPESVTGDHVRAPVDDVIDLRGVVAIPNNHGTIKCASSQQDSVTKTEQRPQTSEPMVMLQCYIDEDQTFFFNIFKDMYHFCKNQSL